MKIQSPLATTQLLVSGNTILSGTLDVDSNTNISGDLSVQGNITGSVKVAGDILPTDTDQYNLGSEEKRFKDIYLSGSTIFLGNVKLSESEEGTLKVVDADNNEIIVGEVDTEEIDNRLESLEIESGSIRTALNNYTSSADNRLESLETESGSIRTAFNNYTSSLSASIIPDGSNLLLSGNLSTEGSISASEFSATTYKNNTGQSITNFFTTLVNGSTGSSDWTGGAPYVATKTVTGLLSTDRPIIDIDLSEVSFANIIDIQDDWSYVYRVEASNDNELKIYSTEEPVNNFQILIQVIR